jgi:ribosomal protein S18 acetylase RimI-like enzyme
VATVDLLALAAAEKEPVLVTSALAAELDAFARTSGTILDWLRLDAADTRVQEALVRRGFRVIDLIFSLARREGELARPAASPRGVTVRAAREDDVPWLRALSASAFEPSRFNDPEGPTGWNALTYSRWIDARMAQRGSSLHVLVAEVEGRRAGFLIWKVHETPGTSGLTGQVDLVAVDPAARGRGAGRALFDEARRLSPALTWVAADVYARNPLGLALHQRYGLEIAAASVYLHRWHR